MIGFPIRVKNEIKMGRCVFSVGNVQHIIYLFLN